MDIEKECFSLNKETTHKVELSKWKKDLDMTYKPTCFSFSEETVYTIECSECGNKQQYSNKDKDEIEQELFSMDWAIVRPVNRDYIGPVCGHCLQELKIEEQYYPKPVTEG